MITTAYVDLRAPEDRKNIRTLIKGCHRQHALEDGDTILVSPVRRFRKEGENLIRDEQEGLATMVGPEIVEPETPEEAFKRRRLADVDDAVKLLDSWVRVAHQRASCHVRQSSGRVSFGSEWWIFSTAIKPETDEEWAAWRAALDPAYDHVSEIGQPAKFAEALGRMVTEQLGPQGKDGWWRGSIGRVVGVAPKTKRPTQWIVHGPVVYSDRLYETLTQDADETTKIAASMFTKSKTHAAQREYRFAILRDGAVAKEVLLTISGMMRDALQPGRSALVRPAPQSTEATVYTEDSELRGRHATATRRTTRRETMRSERRGADGTLLSSESAEREDVRERTVTWDEGVENQEANGTAALGWKPDEGRGEHADYRERCPDGAAPDPGTMDEDAIKEIAFAKEGERYGGEVSASRGTGHVGGSLEQMFQRMLDDPARPMPASSEPWAEAALSREEVLLIYRWIATLTHKVTRVSIENREAASSACWHAIQCIRNIHVRLGDLVDSVSIERERFVILRLKSSGGAKAAGRIVVAPSGAYAYSFKEQDSGKVGHSEGVAGKMFFPLGDEDAFESFGWPVKGD